MNTWPHDDKQDDSMNTAATATAGPFTARHELLVVMFMVATLAVATMACGQGPQPRAGSSGAGADELPEGRVVELETKDKVKLLALYYGSNQGKEAITVLIVHEWRGQASPYRELGQALQSVGCAVIIPEYRGHGGSTEYVDAKGNTKQFSLSRMSKRDIENIIALDLESVKGFLKEENNAEKLNLNTLVVIGAGEGAVFAGQWAQRDWRFPSVGRRKQGQDVKALIYVSPEKQIKGVALEPALTDRNLIQLPMMIVAGEGSREAEEALRIAKRVEAMKKRLGRGTALGFELNTPATKLAGPRLINDVSSVIPSIVKFISAEVAVDEDVNPWVPRE